LFPNVPEKKIAIIPNGFDPEPFKEEAKRNPYLILNTSSPDRHLETTLDIFEKLIETSDKPWKLAWYYGWDNFVSWNEDNKELMDYYYKNKKRFDIHVENGRAEGGVMIPQEDVAKKYKEAKIFLYGTQFYEIHCISAVKAQAGGCYPITSNFAALDESVQYGIKIPTSGVRWGTQSTFGDEENVDKYVEAIESLGEEAELEIAGEQEWAHDTYNWDKISNNWLEIMK
jgi:glycosyltransferase involved in cell wall biosynthesis